MGARRSSGALLLLLLVVAATRAHAAPATPSSPRPPGPQPPRKGGAQPVPTVGTAPAGGRATWARTRLAALARAGVSGDVALSILAQWDFETDGGRGEWNFNVGNIRPVGDEPRVDLGAVGFFRAYASLDEGVRAYLSLVQSGRYTPCWGTLQADPTSDDWVRCLGRLGYYDGSADTYAAGWRARRAALASLL